MKTGMKGGKEINVSLTNPENRGSPEKKTEKQRTKERGLEREIKGEGRERYCRDLIFPFRE